ncbi:YggS family pyridoxal phosphate-dependent enzyme [Lutimonas zeaxanthinifaciens]|uniref:YggS family pyridoxal phosphate-dependent enzyme n=1 Tax=Lutimonas zeaxanthinifaciens TaxID=3060215 RepID=UPI00265CEEF9|nr:YggS family pyridoxal phosphate-dependent enzyme [Lutimonas sp. YSD2104]WKK64673.1 YggS family pyridoxal phosphate-dependent enzyme [Lutimonas sp. YSD2104]
MFVKENLKNFKETLPDHVILVAVSKTKPISDIQDAYEAGHRIFGENKIQEMVNKYEALPKDIEWHMIGHLQRNKVKYMAHFVSLIHGVDSLKTLKEIDKQAKKHDRVINCLLQAKIAKEETKFGLSFEDVENILKSDELSDLTHVKVKGLMGMASFSSDQQIVSGEFKNLKSLFDQLNKDGHQLQILSMGMSGDYKLAIAQGSNMIRVGSAIFGPRNYIAS